MAFQEVELLEATIEVIANIVPGIPVEVDVFVRPKISEISVDLLAEFSRFWNGMESRVMFEMGLGLCLLLIKYGCTDISPLSGLTLANA